MKKRQKKGSNSGGSWIDTYADMVTLLLCFFVLLYSISTADQEKWEALVKSLNPDAEQISVVTEEGYGGINGVTPPEDLEEVEEPEDVEKPKEPKGTDKVFDKMYENLLVMQETFPDTKVTITRTEEEIYITYRDKVFFNGDSHILLKEGKETLGILCNVLEPTVEAIKEIQVLGHTSQADLYKENRVYVDRTLSSMRAAVVTAYIQEKELIGGENLISIGYGQTKPIATNKTPEGRAENRRVEIRIIKNGEETSTNE